MNSKLKTVFKFLGLPIAIIFIAILIYTIPLYFAHKKYEDKARKVAFITIYMKENIQNLQRIKLKICDSIYSYTFQEIKDTISENLAISDRIFPCEVRFIYEYKNFYTTSFTVEDFNCAGCSGANQYILEANQVSYQYYP